MLNAKSKIRSRSIKIAPHSIEVLFGDNGTYPVSLVLPSASEIAELRNVRSANFSIKGRLEGDPLGISASFRSELERQSLKHDKYGDSSTYLMNMYGFSRLAGENELAEKYLKDAVKIDDDPALLHALGDYLVAENKADTAKQIFSDCDLSCDAYANLRIAYFEITKNNDVRKASEYVQNALKIDASDYRSQMFAGALYISKGEFEKAIRAFRVAELSNQRSSTLHANKAIAYWGMGYRRKTIDSLRIAVALNPLNENAVAFYSEAVYQSGLFREEEKAIKALERFIEHEQTNPLIWLALARSYYFKGEWKYKNNEPGLGRQEFFSALKALRQAEDFTSSAGIWNNMALVYWRTGDHGKAGRFFMQSLKVANDNSEDELLPLYNLSGLLIENRQYKEALKVISKRVSSFERLKNLNMYESRIALQFVLLLEAVGKRDKAIVFTKAILNKNISEADVVVDLLTRSLSYNTVVNVNESAAEHDAELLMSALDQSADVPKELRDRAINNIIFSLLCSDRIDEAGKLLSRISSIFHKDQYATATLGLYQVKKGRTDEGEKLYRESLSLTAHKRERDRFKQRMHYELGKALNKMGETAKALRHIEKALHQKYGLPTVNSQIRNYAKTNLSRLG